MPPSHPAAPPPRRPAVGSVGAWPPSALAVLRLWPWRGSLAAAIVVDLVVGALRHFDFVGIEGFSTLNWGWLAGCLVGGVGLAWRLAGPPPRGWLLVRPLVAPAVAFAICFVAVTLTGLVFLPGQPLLETLTTDAPGRAVWLALAVALGSCLSEIVRLLQRALTRR